MPSVYEVFDRVEAGRRLNARRVRQAHVSEVLAAP